METALNRWLGVRPAERKRTALLFLYLFLATLFVILGRTARDTLFLSRASLASLPWMYVGIALATGAMATLYSRLLSTSLGMYALLQSTLLLVVGFVLSIRVMMHFDVSQSYAIFYIGMEVSGSLIVLQFWTFVNESFNAREAKRLFGVIGSGGILGAIVGGFSSTFLVDRLGVDDLLLVCASSLVLCSIIGAGARRANGRVSRQERVPNRAPPRSGGLIESIAHNRYTLLLTAMAVLLTLAVSFIDYQFKVQAQSHYEEAELAIFFGQLYGVCGLISFVFHFFFTGKLLIRLGLLVPLIALPLALVFGSLSLIIWPLAFIPILLTKGADVTLRYSLYDSVIQLLYIPLPIPLRRRLKAAIDGVVKPVAIALAGGFLLLSPILSNPTVGAIVLCLLGAWLLAAVNVRQGYTRALMDSLCQGGSLSSAGTNLNDVASIRSLVEALRHGDEATVCAALELLPPQRKALWPTHVLPLLGSPRSKVRLAALLYIERENVPVHTGRVEALLADPSEPVRAAAVGWYARGDGDTIDSRLMACLRDPGAMVRSRAAIELLGRSAQVEEAAKTIEAMAEAHDPSVRSLAAKALGETGIPGAEARLLVLLDDEFSEVQRSAVEAAGLLPSVELREALLGLLGSRIGAEAAVALAKEGKGVLPFLVKGLERAEGDEVYRLHLLQALKGVGGLESIEALLQHLPKEPDVRYELLKAASAILNPSSRVIVPRDLIVEALARELDDCVIRWTVLADIEDSAGYAILKEALEEELLRSRRRGVLILALVYPREELVFLNRALESREPALVANAIEVLDGSLDKELRPYILPLIEDASPLEILRGLNSAQGVAHRTPRDWLKVFIEGTGDRWVRMCALYVVGELGLMALEGELRGILKQDGDPVVRETVLSALLKILGGTEAAALCDAYAQDPADLVRHLALSQGTVGVQV